MAPQLTLMKLFLRRRLRSCRRPASTSFPTPVSPWSRTVVSTGPRDRMISTSASIRGLRKMASPESASARSSVGSRWKMVTSRTLVTM